MHRGQPQAIQRGFPVMLKTALCCEEAPETNRCFSLFASTQACPSESLELTKYYKGHRVTEVVRLRSANHMHNPRFEGLPAESRDSIGVLGMRVLIGQPQTAAEVDNHRRHHMWL